MGDMKPVNIPSAPSKPDLNEIYDWSVAVNNWLEQNFGSGLQATFLSNNQLGQISQKKDTGKTFYNSDDNTYHATVIEGGNVVVKKFTLT